jgi:thiamine biosynthesis protein ThiI
MMNTKNKEIILCKYGEIVLKGANRRTFEDMLCKEVRRRAARFGNFDVYRAQSTVYIEPKDDSADIDGCFEASRKIFGFAAVARCAVCEKNIDAIKRCAAEYLPEYLADKKTFKVEAKRSDKTFQLDSMGISAEIGGEILRNCPHLKVDVRSPEITVKVEIREFGAYIHAGQFSGAGGMPIGSNGKGLLLLSGGIDSPVAGYMLAKRGVKIEALHFESFPYTSERAKEKVVELAKIVSEYSGPIWFHVISLTHIQEELRRCCDEDYFTLLLRRFMMEIANRIAKKFDCSAIITGESVGQVASQTIEALTVTDARAKMPVFRPCIGMDKEEIVQIARKINTFETSILPFEDCCTVFTPRHPKTKPELHKVEAQEKLVDFDALVEEALETLETFQVKYYE